LTSRKWRYASSGKACLFHILEAAQARGKILIPAISATVYWCPSRGLGLAAVFYDVDPRDLNPSLESAAFLAHSGEIGQALVPSLYGNPADLAGFESACRAHGVFVIDDAARVSGLNSMGG